MHFLFAINQLSVFAGGSILPLEVAEHLRALGHDCTIAANFAADPLKGLAEAAGILVTEDIPALNGFEYDLVWCQNQTAPLLRFEITPLARERTLFVFAHLSTQTPLEVPGLAIEPLIADIVLANSPETREYLLALGLSEHLVDIFPNPAPDPFWSIRSLTPETRLKTVLLVSNHPPTEATEALMLLEQRGVRVRLVGRGGYVARVTPYLLERTNAVITIGKTVQYAIACGKTPYVYDRFGGPGYLDEGNFEAAASSNFSGRSDRKIVDAATMADEIVSRFSVSSMFVKLLSNEILAPFRLGRCVEKLLDRVQTAPSNVERLSSMRTNLHLVARERILAIAIRENFAGHVRANDTIKRLRRHIAGLTKPPSSPDAS